MNGRRKTTDVKSPPFRTWSPAMDAGDRHCHLRAAQDGRDITFRGLRAACGVKLDPAPIFTPRPACMACLDSGGRQ